MIPLNKKGIGLLPSLSESRQKQREGDTISRIISCLQLLSQRVNKLCNLQQKVVSAGPPFQNLQSQRVEERFQKVFSAIPKLPALSNLQKQNNQRKHLTQVWLGKLCQEVFSITFAMFETQKLNERKTKAFCCQNMLCNIIKMIQQNNLTAEQISNIDRCFRNELIPYFLIKYPMSEEAEVNQQFNNIIIQTDRLGDNQNDLVFRSKIKFNYHSDGNYNRQIMRLINYIIQLPNIQIQQTGETLYKMFYNDMESFFKKVEDQKFTLKNNKTDIKNLLYKALSLEEKLFKEEKDRKYNLQEEKQRQKYRQNVKSYTKRFINRKISENIKPFSQRQIKHGELIIKNPSIMRIIVKWCVQLMQNFDTYQKILNKEQQFRMKDGSQKILKRKHLFILSELLNRQKKKIDEYLVKVNENNSQCQFDFGKMKLAKKMQKFSEEQSSVGLFAADVISNYQIYLVGYVNTIIHALMTATKEYEEMVKAYEYKQDQFGQLVDKWRDGSISFDDLINKVYSYRLSDVPGTYMSLVPQLISFRVGDILRCKCTSNQKQIIALYKQLQNISRNQNTQMKIVRMKNRLQKGTKDILVNLMYRNTMLIQMQLSITTNRSKFIDFSNKFNHVLYQLSRAEFGPISQMCNIWINNDIKANFYIEEAKSLNFRKNRSNVKQNHLCSGQAIQFPFRCSQCNYFYNDCQYALKHIQCNQRNCKKKICSLCRAQKFDYATMKKYFRQLPSQQILGIRPGQNFFEYRRRSSIQNNQSKQFLGGLQRYGMIINLKGQQLKAIFYINMKIRTRNIIVNIKNLENQEFNILQQVNTKQKQRVFKKQYLIFSSPKLTQILKNVEVCEKLNRFMTEYKFPKLIKKWKQKEKSAIVYMSGDLKDQDVSKIRQNLSFIKKFNFYCNKITDIQQCLQKFDKCEIVDLGYNQVQKLTSEGYKQKQYPDIKVLYLNHNLVSSIDQLFVAKYKNVEEIYLARNKIKNLAKNFGQLKNIKILNLSRNCLEQIPQQVTQLKSLRVLTLNTSNSYPIKLKCLPQSIGNLQNLKKININFNKITELPNSIGDLKKLEVFYAANNSLKKLPQSFTKLSQLKILNLAQNVFDTLPEEISYLTKLQTLNLQNSSDIQLPTKTLPQSYCNLVNIKMMDISQNKITQLPENICNLTSLQTFFIYDNKLRQIPQSIGKLKSLKLLYASNNQLLALPESICQLQNLEKLAIKQNKFISSLPDNIGKLKKLKYLCCYGNSLRNVPKSVGDLIQLKQLLIQQNNINNLPQSLANLNKITRLQIDYQQLDNQSKKRLKSMGISYNKS